MLFISKNPLVLPQIEETPSVPVSGTRGLFAKPDGWYDIDSEGKTQKLSGSTGGGDIDEEEIREIVDAELEEAKISGEFNGKDGKDGVGIQNISCHESTESGGINQISVSMTDGKLYNFNVKNGERGDDGSKGDQGLPGKDGSDGFSPITTVEQTDDGAVITITDKNGTTTATVKNGQDGQDGEDGLPGKDGSDGQDGVSCTHSWGGENGTILTIKSASGMSSADLKGADGKDGVGITDISYYESTESGGVNQLNISTSDGMLRNFYIRNGEKGEKGDTPIKGEDYWTEADKAEIKSYTETTQISKGSMLTLETNKVYSVTSESPQAVSLPEVNASIQNQILVYLKMTEKVSIAWGDVVFVDGKDIPTIGIGCYRIIFEYNPALEKWVVGVIQDGVVT